MFTANTKKSLIKGILTKKSPIYVQYAITKNCNLQCKMCASSSSRKTDKDLSPTEINIIAENLEKLGAGVVVLTGGEPFLRPDLPEIIKIFSSKGFTVRLQTNGLLATEEKIRKASEAGANEISISLETLNPDKQDTITNRKGSWTEIIKAISRFSQILPAKNSVLGINTIVSKENIDDVVDVIKFSTAVGFWCSLIPVHTALDSKDGDFIIRTDAMNFAFSKEDHPKIDEFYKQVISMKKQGYHVYNSYKFLKNSPAFLKGNRIPWRCDSPYLYFAISPSGNFLPCVDLKTDISILDKNFYKKYKSKEFHEQIRKMVANCKGCYYACWPEMTYLCRDIFVLTERLFLGIKSAMTTRKPVSYEKCLEIAKNIRKTH